MGILKYEFYSVILGCETTITMTIPELHPAVRTRPLEDIYRDGVKFPTIYMLHGGGESSGSWIRQSQIERLSNEKRFMTVAIDAMESFYCDMAEGRKYFTYLTQEVMRLVQTRFHSSPLREDNFVLGFSMGAHGAMKVALRCPEKFTACFAMSGAKDQVKMGKLALEMGISADNSSVTRAFGPMDEIYGSENDLLHLAKGLKESGKPAPLLYMSCGTEDYGFELCKEYKDYLDGLGLKNEFFAVPGGHDYEYAGRMLDKAVNEVLAIRNIW